MFERQVKLRCSNPAARISGPVSAATSDRHDAVEALAALGFDENKASACVNDILKSRKDATLEEVIKEALRLLA